MCATKENMQEMRKIFIHEIIERVSLFCTGTHKMSLPDCPDMLKFWIYLCEKKFPFYNFHECFLEYFFIENKEDQIAKGNTMK